MSGSDDIAARLTVLDTIVRQLITHLAVRSDDPVGWVQTRKVLAAHVIEAASADALPPPPIPPIPPAGGGRRVFRSGRGRGRGF
jgi:hypothetical protein